jgi:phospholipase/carboxylesterase
MADEGLARYESVLAPLTVAVLETLYALEHSQRHLDPSRVRAQSELLAPRAAALASTVEAFRAANPPEGLRGFHERWEAGAKYAERAARCIVDGAERSNPVHDFIVGMKAMARAQEALYAIHEFPPLSRYFVEPSFHSELEALDPPRRDGVSVGLHYSGGTRGAGARGHFCLYVPESYDGSSDWPLVVALHGGVGSGREFLWTWLREARGRRFLLLAPTAIGPTWSLIGPDVDGERLRRVVSWVCERWRVTPDRVLLTGLSDGATYTLLTGLAEGSPFTALAPIAGVLHPVNAVNGNLDRAAGTRIYLVHGALDWMFPVQTARWARDRLEEAGASLVYREIADLSHTYPREENGRILAWLDPSLAISDGENAS